MITNRDKPLINELQYKSQNIRNFCILAHVDHGKTTLADNLLATNGIISTRMSGKLRYMDSRQDEQQRGITMKSSAISLVYRQNNEENYLINLIDSPGHIDFSSEVSTAVRICDGAAIIIDVCEGICAQTHAVLRQAWMENLKLILVFNKIDRLILELKMTPQEAYYHMENILGQFNAIVAQQFTSLLMEKKSKLLEQGEDDNLVEFDDDIDESNIYFLPKYNNVFFASSIDGWGFSIKHFAELYASKLGFKRDSLISTLWGDYFLNTKTKRIMKNAHENGKKPLFVQFVLENLWQTYEAVLIRRDSIMTEKILKSLNITLKLHNKNTDTRNILQSLFLQWLPIGRNLLDMIVEILPSPLKMSNDKIEKLICSNMNSFTSLPKEIKNLKNDFLNCDRNGPVIVFISKMFATERENLSRKQTIMSLEDIQKKREIVKQRKINETLESTNNDVSDKQEESEQNFQAEDPHVFLAFARVFSGTLRKKQELFILSPKHNPEDFVGKDVDILSDEETIQKISKQVQKVNISDLYLMMGRELIEVDEVPCGNIVAIGGLERHCLRTATLSSTPLCPSFSEMHQQTAPIMRVSVQPKNPSKIKDLERGLKLLNQADPCVEIVVEDNGEYILCTAGEVHLQRCIEDLVNLFAKCEINVSQPIVPFRETIVKSNKFSDLTLSPSLKSDQSLSTQTAVPNQQGMTETQTSNESFRRVESASANQLGVKIQVKAYPLPNQLTKLLEENASLLKKITKLKQNKQDNDTRNNIDFLKELRKKLETIFQEEAKNDELYSNYERKSIVDRIISFGPNRYGPNILVNMDDDLKISNIWSFYDSYSTEKSTEYEKNLILGFDLAISKGPICEEPMQGVAIFIEKLEIDLSSDIDTSMSNLDLNNVAFEKKSLIAMGSKTSSIISSIKFAFKRAIEAQPLRLMAAMYKCEAMTVSSEALGKLYAVLGKRNARIIEESVKENTNMFLVKAQIPIIDSFGLAEEVRKRTSGLATLHLEYSHYETIDIDPYWEPKTEEELLHFGDKADFENQAKKYMNTVRKRKGLLVREKLVEHSEKQRTLTIK